MASSTKARCVRVSVSKSLARRRQRPNQPNVRSTIQRFWSTTKPFPASERFTISKSGPCRPAHRPGCLPALVGPIRDHPLQKGKEPSHLLQDTQAAVTILHVAGQNGAAEHQTECVNNGVALAPFDLLGRIIAHRIGPAPPFRLLSRSGCPRWPSWGWLLAGHLTRLRRERDEAAPACRRNASAQSRRARCCAGAGPWAEPAIGSPCPGM